MVGFANESSVLHELEAKYAFRFPRLRPNSRIGKFEWFEYTPITFIEFIWMVNYLQPAQSFLALDKNIITSMLLSRCVNVAVNSCDMGMHPGIC